MKNFSDIFPKWAKIALFVLSSIAIVLLSVAFALQKWADSQVESANLVLIKFDKSKSAELNFDLEGESKSESNAKSQIYAYEARVHFERLDFLLRSRTISHIDIKDIAWVSGIDSTAIKSIETHNRRLNFTTTQNLALDSGANLGTMSFKMDFAPLPTAIAWYYLWIAFAVIFVCMALFFSKANALNGGGGRLCGEAQNALFTPQLTLFSTLYLLFFALNFLFPTQSDNLGAGFGGLSTAYNFYMTWNGRIGELFCVAFGSYLAHTALYPFINALVCVAFIYLFFILIFARLPFMGDLHDDSHSKQDISVICFIMLCLFIFKGFGSVFYWACGSYNYLWAWVLIMAWCVPFRLFWGEIFAKDLRIFDKSSAKSSVFAMLILGIFAGWASEFGIVLIIAQFAFIAFALYKRVKIPAWYFAGVIGFIAGWLILYLSPGHAARANIVNALNNDKSYVTIAELLAMPLVESFKRFIGTFKDTMSHLLVAILCVLVFLWLKFSSRSNKAIIAILALSFIALYSTPNLRFVFVFLGALLCFVAGILLRKESASGYLFVLSGLFLAYFLATAATIQMGVPARAKLPYLLLGMAQIIVVYLLIKPYLTNCTRFVSVWIRIVCAFFALFVVSECATMRLKWERMLSSIEAQKAMGSEVAVVSADTFRSNYRGYGDWGNPNQNTNEWPNTTYAKVFGVEKFVVVETKK